MCLEGTASAGTAAAVDLVANCHSALELVGEFDAVELAATGAGVELAAVELTDTATATGGGPGGVGNGFVLRHFFMNFWAF